MECLDLLVLFKAAFTNHTYGGIWLGSTLLFIGLLWTPKTRIYAAILLFINYKILKYVYNLWYEVDWMIEYFLLFALVAAKKKNSEQENLFAISLIILVALIYFDSLFIKYTHTGWVEGVTFWRSLYYPPFVNHALPDFKGNDKLFRFINYYILIYETIFILALFKPLRKLIVISGIFLHSGIMIFTPLNYFGLLMLAPLFAVLNWQEKIRQIKIEWKSLEMAIIVLITISYIDYKLFQKNKFGILQQITGSHGTAVYADSQFQLPFPLYKLRLKTDSGGFIDVATYTNEGYSELSNRAWKNFNLFPRQQRCGKKVLANYLRLWEHACESNLCAAQILIKEAQLVLGEIEYLGIKRIKEAKWYIFGDLIWDKGNLDNPKFEMNKKFEKSESFQKLNYIFNNCDDFEFFNRYIERLKTLSK